MISVVLKINLMISSLLLVGCLFETTEIKFQSVESKTSKNLPVYNSVKLIVTDQKDIWMMNQSHFGENPIKENLDRIAIIIDKTKKPKVAEFYQLPPGELNWSEDLKFKKIGFKVSCFSCHANGPRAIRPHYENYNLSYADQIKIKYWNYKISKYGRVIEAPQHAADDQNRDVPFRFRSVLDNQQLNLKTCLACHNENSVGGRGYLTRQNIVTMKYLMNEKIMPPDGYEISEAEKIEFTRFVNGFR